MKDLYIYGAGGTGQEIYAIAERKNAGHSLWGGIHFVDDTVGGKEDGVLRYADFLALHRPADSVEFLIANGEPAYRRMLRRKLRSDGYDLATLVDDTAVVARGALVEPGAVIYPFVCVSPNAVIGRNSLLYYHVSVAHDSVIGTDSLLSMSACVSGHCVIAEACFLGASSMVRERVEMGEFCILGSCSALLDDAPDCGVYGGVPAKRLRENLAKRVFS